MWTDCDDKRRSSQHRLNRLTHRRIGGEAKSNCRRGYIWENSLHLQKKIWRKCYEISIHTRCQLWRKKRSDVMKFLFAPDASYRRGQRVRRLKNLYEERPESWAPLSPHFNSFWHHILMVLMMTICSKRRRRLFRFTFFYCREKATSTKICHDRLKYYHSITIVQSDECGYGERKRNIIFLNTAKVRRGVTDAMFPFRQQVN